MGVEATVCWIIRDGKALLKLANKGISKGKWNAVGGKVEPGETPVQCAIRETKEESGLDAKDLAYHGRLGFFFINGKTKKPVMDWSVHVFSTKNFSGDVKESAEGKLKWFPISSLPYETMWEDDLYWVPIMLAGKAFEGSFTFSHDNSRMLMHEIKELGPADCKG